MCNTLLGCAISDALGVFAEGKLSTYRPLLDWDGKTFLGSERHGLKPGEYSDDTAFSITLAESLINNNGFNPDDISKKYVDLVLSGRSRGFGRTTYAAIQNLQSGIHWSESGIPGSYGNGSAMRASPIGIFFRNDIKSLVESATIDAQITHASNEAIAGSIAIALAAAFASNNDLENLTKRICEYLPDSKVKSKIYGLESLINADHIAPQQALSVLGTGADVKETVPSSIYCFLKFDNFTDAIITAIKAGKDADTTAAITGSLIASNLGINGIDSIYYTVEDFDKLTILDSQLFNRNNHKYF